MASAHKTRLEQMRAAPEFSAAAPVRQVAQRIGSARHVVVLCHVNPDADTLGSALALGLALEATGTRVEVAFDESEIPESLADLPGRHLITTLPADDADLVVCVDVASAGRLGGLVTLLDTARSSIVIDHHASNPGFAALNWIDPHAEATVVMIAALLDELQCPLTPHIAANLYAGLATDTVNFRFASPDGHRLAARLVDAGVNAGEVLRPISDTHPFGWLGMLGSVLAAAELDPSAARGLGQVVVQIPLTAAAGLRREELDAVIDIIRTCAEAEVAVVTKQVDDATWQVSMRSHGAVDVSAIAAHFGGGGHSWAAGYTFTGGSAELLGSLRKAWDTV
jgi:phosphoesterase RecJ-like protein